MGKRRARHQSHNTSRLDSIGPVFALLSTEETAPLVVKTVLPAEEIQKGHKTVKLPRRVTYDHPRNTFNAKVLAIASGGVSTDQVKAPVSLTTKSRQPVQYRADGKVAFSASAGSHEAMTSWLEQATPLGQLVIARIHLHRQPPEPSATGVLFKPEIVEWDHANAGAHLPDHLPRPASGLILPQFALAGLNRATQAA